MKYEIYHDTAGWHVVFMRGQHVVGWVYNLDSFDQAKVTGEQGLKENNDYSPDPTMLYGGYSE